MKCYTLNSFLSKLNKNKCAFQNKMLIFIKNRMKMEFNGKIVNLRCNFKLQKCKLFILNTKYSKYSKNTKRWYASTGR